MRALDRLMEAFAMVCIVTLFAYLWMVWEYWQLEQTDYG